MEYNVYVFTILLLVSFVRSRSPQENRFSEWKEWSPCSATCGDGTQERERDCISGGCIQKQWKTCGLCACKEDIVEWSKWTSCSATCGQGVITRQRKCAVGSRVEKQTMTCFLEQCGSPRNISGFEPWQEWSECSATCGQGERRRARKCKSGTCEENAVQTCSVRSCGGTGTPDEYRDWQAWSECSVTCGVGEQNRIRRCVVGICQQVMRKACSSPTCCPGQTRDDNFLPWAKWSKCTVTCGWGERRRARRCKAPATCVENQAQSCNVEGCVIENGNSYDDWSKWSQCSASCGSGEAKRQRKNLNTGKTQEQLKQCAIAKCETDDEKYRCWINWSGCSVTCGTGIATRVRQCRVGSCEDTQTKACTLDDCEPIDLDKKYGVWSSWSKCSETCGFGFARRKRYCRIGECEQTSSKTCRLGPCKTDYTNWEDWGPCSVNCGSGISTRKRYCTVGTCEEKQQTPCDMPTCATGWEDWSNWQGCHKTCGDGVDYRTRRCKEPLPSVQCPGDDYDYRKCNTHSCIPVTTPGIGKLDDNAGRSIKNDVAAGDVPWYTLLFSDEKKVITEANKAKLGGGSLINDKWVLTSAHIFDDSQRSDLTSIVLLFGVVTELSGANSVPSYAQFYKAGQIVSHPKYNKTKYDYDISLVKVGARLDVKGVALVPDSQNRGGKVQFSQFVRPIALPCISSCDQTTDTTQNGISISPYDRNRCLKYAHRFKSVTKPSTVVSGYSAAKSGESSKLRLYSNKLFKAPKCREEMTKIRRVHRRARFTRRNVCTNKMAPPQPCAGRSGDPLMKQVQGSKSEKCWVLLGVVTWNWSCTTSNVQYYADVPKLISWIAKTMA